MKFLPFAALVAILGFGTAQAAEPLSMNLSGAYVGAHANAQVFDNTAFGAGVTAGYQWNKFVATELTLDHMQNHRVGNTAMVNVLAGYPVASTPLTPYVLVGTGLAFDDSYRTPHTQQFRYAVGAGLGVAVTESVGLDLRYTANRSFNTSRNHDTENVISLGVIYRF